LLRAAADHIAQIRDEAIAKALRTGSGMKGVDACWEELRRQAEDGTTKAWLSLCAAGLVDRSARNLDLDEVAQLAAVDGCAVALASGIPLADARDAYNALWLALMDIAEPV